MSLCYRISLWTCEDMAENSQLSTTIRPRAPGRFNHYFMLPVLITYDGTSIFPGPFLTSQFRFRLSLPSPNLTPRPYFFETAFPRSSLQIMTRRITCEPRCAISVTLRQPRSTREGMFLSPAFQSLYECRAEVIITHAPGTSHAQPVEKSIVSIVPRLC